jgi:hypothetical protein
MTCKELHHDLQGVQVMRYSSSRLTDRLRADSR